MVQDFQEYTNAWQSGMETDFPAPSTFCGQRLLWVKSPECGLKIIIRLFVEIKIKRGEYMNPINIEETKHLGGV